MGSEYFLPLIYMATIQTFNMSIRNKTKICSHPQRQWHACEYFVYIFLNVFLSKIAFILFFLDLKENNKAKTKLF